VITNAFEEANLYSVITRHFKEELLLGSDKFYRAARAALGVQTWRPRVQVGREGVGRQQLGTQ
jgi:hypothetical protein